MKRTSLRRISAKRRAELPLRREACRIVALRSEGLCEARLEGCTGQGEDFHEVLARSQGGSITDPTNIRHLCRHCHEVTVARPNYCRTLGLVAPRGA